MPEAERRESPVQSISAELEKAERILRNSVERARVEYDAAREKYQVALKRFSALTVSGVIPDNLKKWDAGRENCGRVEHCGAPSSPPR